jgi:hypothetical protein
MSLEQKLFLLAARPALLLGIAVCGRLSATGRTASF